jgi:L-aminopeptidase/D-esterase-like protein
VRASERSARSGHRYLGGRACPDPMPGAHRTLTLVRGVKVGQVETPDRTTGVTVVRFDPPASVVVDVRGGASGTYDTGSLSVDATFGRRFAIFFAGGSLYGLDAARGIRVRILEEGGGRATFGNPNPVVPISGAILFDLPRTRGAIPDYLPLGYEAARTADARPVAEGAVGAGAGATVGKYLGRDRAMPGGVASAARGVPGAGRVGVLVAVNSAGAIRDAATGRWAAGARGPGGRVVPPGGRLADRDRTTGTTLTLVATDVALERPALARVAAIAHAGVAAGVHPFQSSTDGDVLFAAATAVAGQPRAETRPGENADRIGTAAAELAGEALVRAVRASARR